MNNTIAAITIGLLGLSPHGVISKPSQPVNNHTNVYKHKVTHSSKTYVTKASDYKSKRPGLTAAQEAEDKAFINIMHSSINDCKSLTEKYLKQTKVSQDFWRHAQDSLRNCKKI